MVRVVQPELRFDRWYLPLSVPLGLGPKNSELRLEAGALHVKMGWAFSAAIPLTSIKSAEPVETRVYSEGVHYGSGRYLCLVTGLAGWWLSSLVTSWSRAASTG